jgi:tetratricopeptide (TPR) repeat protein
LISAALLSKEGYKVCVLEKNKQIGGCLQSFGFDGKLFESAVHSIGSLDKGQTLYSIFNYLGVIDTLALIRLDMDCFDEIRFGQQSYRMAQGHEHFIDTLSASFPNEHNAICAYVCEMRHVCEHFPMYNLRIGNELKCKAFTDASEIIRINPEYYDAYRIAGDEYAKEGKKDSALLAYKKALTLEIATEGERETIAEKIKRINRSR